MRNRIFRAAAALALLSACALAGCSAAIERPVTVMLAVGEGYSIEGENPVSVLPGEDASFSVRLEDGWSFVGCDGASYEDGVLTVSRVLYPTTITPDVREHVEYRTLSVYDPAQHGRIVSNVRPGTLVRGTTVALRAEPDEGFAFVGWTDASGVLLCPEASYTFTLDADTELCARFRSEEEEQKRNTALLVYNANGGVCTIPGSDGERFYQDVSTEIYKLPNCLGDLGYFEREGYALVEYNTKPDGSGEGYSPGSKILLGDEENAVLFCIWMKEADEADFVYKEKDGGIIVTGYTGDAGELAIPAYIGGKPVTEIAPNAIRDKTMEKLSLPTTLRVIREAAIRDCARLTTVYFPDSIEYVTDSSFYNCPEYRNFYIYAATEPRYGPGVSLKFEALVTTQEQNRIIVVSGSSSWNGLDSKQLGRAFDDKYYVVNYGTNAGTPAAMYMEMISHFVHEGDIVVQAPEDSANQLGSSDMTWKMYRETEAYFNLYRYIDVRRYTKMYSSFTEHQKTRLPMAPASYTALPGNYDEHGDMTRDRSALNDPKYTSNFNISYSPKALNDRFAQNLNETHRMLTDAGATVYVSFAPHNANGLTRTARTDENKRAYTERFREALNAPVISYLGDYTLAGQYIYDSDWHPNDEGRRIRTEQLAKDLRVQMIADGLWKD